VLQVARTARGNIFSPRSELQPLEDFRLTAHFRLRRWESIVFLEIVKVAQRDAFLLTCSRCAIDATVAAA